MRRNTVTYWHEADLANRETCSLIRINDAFRKTLLQATKKKSRKLTSHGKQLLPRALRELWETIGREEGSGGVRYKQHYKHVFFLSTAAF